MAIAYLTSQYPAPSHTFIRRELAALRRRGLDVRPFSVRKGTETDDADDAAVWSARPIAPLRLLRAHLHAARRHPLSYLRTLRNAQEHRVPGLKAQIWSLMYFAQAIDLAKELEAQGVDHVHNHFANSAAIVGLLASRYLGLPWSVTIHGTADFDYPSGVLLEDKIELADFVACVSSFARAQAMREVDDAHWDKLIVARCGVELDRLPAHRPSPSGAPVHIVSVGRLSPEKGQVGLLLAFADLLAAGHDARLSLVGDGELREQLEQVIRRKGLASKVTLLGVKPEAETLEIMATADLFVLSSLMEGLPVVLMEALGIGVPVVAPAVAGIPELVEEGRSGWLYPAGQWDALTQAMLRAVEHRTEWAQMGARGRARVEAQHDVERAIEPLLERFSREVGR